jgi:hypothetical protein
MKMILIPLTRCFAATSPCGRGENQIKIILWGITTLKGEGILE